MAEECDSANDQRTGIMCCKCNNVILYESSYAIVKSRLL